MNLVPLLEGENVLPARYREKRWGGGAPGRAYWDYTPIGSRALTPVSNWQKTSDFVGSPKTDNQFYSERFTVESFSRINGMHDLYGYMSRQEGAVPSCVAVGSYAVAKSLKGRFESVPAAVQAANPSNPLVALPTFAFELRDVPKMLKHAGELGSRLSNRAGNPPISRIADYLSSPKAIGEDWLAYNFGWKPFLSDILSFSGIADDVRKRHNFLSKGAKRGYMTRRSQLGSMREQVTHDSYPFDSFQYDWFATATDVFTTRRWCVSKWLVDPYSYSGSMRDNQMKLIRQSLGLDVSFQNLWNMMPWTWLVDWFSDAANMIQINSNRHGIRFLNVCVMEHNVATRTITPRPRLNYSSGPAVLKHETKSRTLGFPSILQGGLNYFSPSQLGTLAALKVTRSRWSA